MDLESDRPDPETTLEELLSRRLDLAGSLRIAARLAGALRDLHERGLVHTDVNPANAVVSVRSGAVRLRGLERASRARGESPPGAPEAIVGTPAYMAPEQTGMMNRPIDSRTDLYSLGVTLYRMITGRLPFATADPVQLMHCHVARQPPPPENVPPVIAALLMKLLAKNPEERYQTASGVEADLRRCLDEIESRGNVTEFPLALHDGTGRLESPTRVHGRSAEVAALRAAFERATAQRAPELVLVSGHAGVGKSTLVDEFRRSAVAPPDWFAAGKFHEQESGIPLMTLARALRPLVRQVLARGADEAARLTQALRDALGADARLMTALVPQLEPMLGELPPLEELPPGEAKSRFRAAVRRFLGVFATGGGRLLLFLDDLQWVDAATLEFVQDVVAARDLGAVVVAGAYRDDEVGASHPLRVTIEKLRAAGVRPLEIALGPLSRDDSASLIADLLRCDRERAAPLAELVFEKTSGDPFFAIQFLSELADEGLIEHDPRGGHRWVLHRIRARSFTDDVLDLLLGRLQRLTPETRSALAHLACAGDGTSAGLLAPLRRKSEADVERCVDEALRAGLVVRTGNALTFAHDRIREAVYAVVSERDRAAMHLAIGQLLLEITLPAQLDAHIFDIVSQLNRGASLCRGDERRRLAELNLRAGRRARSAAAYAAAHDYFAMGEALLDADRWERQYPLAFPLSLLLAESELFTGRLDAAEKHLDEVAARAVGAEDAAAATSVRVGLYLTFNQMNRAVGVCLEFLRKIDVAWPPHPSDEEASAEIASLCEELERRPVHELPDLPRMSDPLPHAVMNVLAELVSPTMVTDKNLHALVSARMVRITLLHGECNASSFGLANLAVAMARREGGAERAYRLGELSRAVASRPGLGRFLPRIELLLGHFIIPWTRHLREGLSLVRGVLETTRGRVMALYAGYCLVEHRLACGDPLAEVQRDAERALLSARKARFEFAVDVLVGQLRLIQSLRGDEPFGAFDEERFIARVEAADGPPLPAFMYWVRKLQACVHAGDQAGAMDAAARAQRHIQAEPASFEIAEYHLYAALARAAAAGGAPIAERQHHLDALHAHRRQLESWSRACPQNFAAAAAMVGAEISRLDGREMDAMRLHEAAIASAREQGFVQLEGLASEAAARFHLQRGLRTLALGHLANARACYLRWGAAAKVVQLEERYPELRNPLTRAAPIDAPVGQLDVATIVRASQAVSGEIVLEDLIKKLLQIALEHAGADRAVLLVSRGDELRVEAQARVRGVEVSVELHPHPVSQEDVPPAVLAQVTRTRMRVLDDDPSMLSLPLLKQGRLIGILHLENRLAPRVFTASRVAVLELLASQAAISLETAQLYRELRRSRDFLEMGQRLSQAGTASFDLCTGNASASPEYLRLFGIQPDRTELSADELWSRVHPDDAPRLRAAVADAIRHRKEFAAGFRVVLADGSIRHMHGVGHPMLDDAGRVTEVAGTAMDLTEHERTKTALEDALAELRRRAAYLSIAQQLSLTGSFGLDFRTGSVFWSEEIFRILGIDPALAPSRELVLERTHPDDAALVEEQLGRAEREGAALDFQHRLVMPDGAIKHVRWVAQVNEQGGKLELVGAISDITAIKRSETAEAALAGARTQLAHMARVTTLGELMASIAHEVKQPLTAVVTHASAGLRWLANRDLDNVRQTLEQIRGEARRADEVIRRIRSLVKKSSPQRDPLDLNQAIRDVATLARREIEQSGVALILQLEPGLPNVIADRVQLQQVILNLVVNAVEAMRDQTEKREMRITSTADGDALRVSVADSGPGFPPGTADRMFEPFFSSKPDGMGMGLVISRSIVESHGGRIWTAANDPRGAVFHFSLPTRH